MRYARAQTSQSNGSVHFPNSIRRILVPTDLTNDSEGAIEAGIVLARSFGAKLTLLHVYDVTRYLEISHLVGRYAVDAMVEDRKYCQRELREIAEEIKRHYPDCDTVLREGLPGEEIVRTARELDIDIIIVSTRPSKWLMPVACGGDAEGLLRSAPCPILFLHSSKASVPRKKERFCFKIQ
jgi:nucleotide-binding universal stress UspA family protein